MRNWTIIKDELQYNDAMSRIEEIMDAQPGTPEGDELDLLSLLVEKYEENSFPHPDPEPIDVIKYYIEQRGLKQKDLVEIIGDKSIVSKVINGERV